MVALCERKKENVLRLLRVWPDKHASHALYRKDKKCFGCCKDNLWKPFFFLCSVIFLSSSADFWVDLRRICATTWIIMDLMAKIHSFRLFFCFCVEIFVRICFKLLFRFADQVFFFSLQFHKKLHFPIFCHWVNVMSCNRIPLLREIGLRYSTLLWNYWKSEVWGFYYELQGTHKINRWYLVSLSYLLYSLKNYIN